MDIPGFKLGRQYADSPYCKGYNALNLSNHKTVNIQVFDPSLLAKPEFVDQFREITDRLVGVSFGIMTPILRAEISNRTCYVISEYFPSPQQLASARPEIPRHQVVHLALQLAQTLDQLHRAGLVHGGIEYSALHFRALDQTALRPVILQRVLPVLSAGAISSLERGQRRYLAPEAINELTPASDFYALGVLLYLLLLKPERIDSVDSEQPAIWSFEGEHQGLQSLISQLLATDPAHRIKNLEQFRRALQQCGDQLPGSALTIAKAKQSQGRRTDRGKPAFRPTPKWVLLVAGSALAGLGGSQLLNSSHEATQEPTHSQGITASESAKPEQSTAVQTPLPAETEAAVVLPDFDSLYQQALKQAETDPEAALRTINLLLEQRPDRLAALKLKKRIEQELSVRSLIATAEHQFEELKLLQPSGDNAYESYLALADLLPADDERIEQGFTRIAAALHDEAESLLQQQRLDKAWKTLKLGLSVKADYPPLLDLRIRINERRSALRRTNKQARLERQRREQQQRAAVEHQQETQKRLLEQQTATTLKRQQDEEARAPLAAQMAEQQETKRFQRMKIEQLLSSAHDYLNNVDLTLANVFSAHQDFEQLQILADTDPGIRQLQHDLIDAYTILSLRENSDSLYQSAIAALIQGVPLNPRDRKKLQTRAQLSR